MNRLLIALMLLLVAAAAAPGQRGISATGVAEAPVEHPDDASLRVRVEERLYTDLRIHWELLDVKASDGRIELFGKVRTPDEKALASQVASGVRGVKEVTNHLLVSAPIPDARTN